ncbi:sel1 repeat family protein [Bradyrhizobium ontarionense]|uniref:Sel1 repeat family protein n=1 Tax=Bradyrhizobium ontarionense TaxID=2898149 RepID=A0ABY3RBV3_9BRAD|nr:sel1 repeat family protein [Bradyrhizobium sp. A19]UFZ04233.1 sel1 repeat family protein [Bradyrhizobium sp. A19]
MSAPVQNDPAKPTPPWATEELRKYAPRRHQAQGGPATYDQPLDDSHLPHHLLARPNTMPAQPAANGDDDELPRGLWSSKLDPVVMPLPPEDTDRSSRLGGIIKIGAAIGIAASVAMIVVNMVTFEDHGATQGGPSQMMPSTVLESLAQIDPAEAKVAQEDPPQTVASIMVPTSTDVATRALAPSPASPAPALSGASAFSNPAPAASTASPRPTVPLPRDEVSSLMKRGRDLLAAGDVASARLILTRLSDAGSAEASLLLARTYDPAELTKSRILGAIPDAAKARAWYLKAAEQGSPEASRRISAVR